MSLKARVASIMAQPIVPGPATIMVLGIAGGAAGLAVTLVADGRNPFKGTPEFSLWVALVALQIALWAVLSLPIYRSLGQLFQRPRRFYATGHLVAAAILFALLVIAPFLLPFGQFPNCFKHGAETLCFSHQHGRVLIIVALGDLLVAGPMMLGMSRIQSDAQAFRILTGTPAALPGDAVDDYLLLRAFNRRLLSVGGAAIGAATLSAGALRTAIAAQTTSPPRAELVLILGAYYSVLLATAYIPAHAALLGAGKGLVEAMVPAPPPLDDPKGWSDKRTALSELMKLESTSKEAVQLGLGLLAPLLGSIIALVGFPTKS